MSKSLFYDMSKDEANGVLVKKDFGIKGQRWGHRKDQGEAKPKSKSANVKSLSDAELKAVVERMNLEERYSKLSATQATKSQRLAKFATDIVVNAAKTTITNEVSRQFSSGLTKVVKP